MIENQQSAVSEQPMTNENIQAWMQDALSRFPEPISAAPHSEPEEAPPAKEEKPLPTTVAPLPTPEEAAAMQSRRLTMSDVERGQYWSSILTGDVNTVPDSVRKKAGADDAAESPDRRNYKLLSAINRSWVVDHLNTPKEKVRSDWGRMRAEMADSLGVESDEREVFCALSDRREEENRRQWARQVYEEAYLAGLYGRDLPETSAEESESSAADPALVQRVRNMAQQAGKAEREELMPLLHHIHDATKSINAYGKGASAAWDLWSNAPDVFRSMEALADMDDAKRSRLYGLVREMAHQEQPPEDDSTLSAMARSFMRAPTDIGMNAGQALGNIGTAIISRLGDFTDSDAIKDFAKGSDKRLRVLEELRRFAQNEVFPIKLPEDSGLHDQLLVDFAGAIPGAALAFCGGAGFAGLALSSAGASMAEARQRAPQGSQELQTAAGVLGGSMQAGIYMLMGRVGKNLLGQSINEFVRASGTGLKGYSIASLNSLRNITAENLKLLMAGKAATVTDMAMQEAAAQVHGTASNIDWQSYGDNLTDIETNMREAAVQLPYILIASGRAGLHYFQSRYSVLGKGYHLDDWGVDAATRDKIMNAPNLHVQNTWLRDALRSSRRWSGPEAMAHIMRSMRLLNTPEYQGFNNEQIVRDFLNLPAQNIKTPPPVARESEAALREQTKHHLERARRPQNDRTLPMLKLMDEWWQRSNISRHAEAEKYLALNTENIWNPTLSSQTDYARMVNNRSNNTPQMLQQRGYYVPNAEVERMALFNACVQDIKDLSYQFLLNTYSLDALSHGYRSPELAREGTEEQRHKVVALACRSILERVCGKPPEEIYDSASSYFKDFYYVRMYRDNPPYWLKGSTRNAVELREMPKRFNRVLKSKSVDASPEYHEALRIMLGLQANARRLYDLIPHLEDFHTLLSRGMSPQQAYAFIINREFRDSLGGQSYLPEGWTKMQHAGKSYTMQDYTDRNADMFKIYSQMSGNGLESSVGAGGKTYWRIRRPDGRYTHWHDAPEHAVNDLAASAGLRFLPMNRDAYREMLQQGQRAGDMAASLRQGNIIFSGYEQLTLMATQDIVSKWMTNVATRPLGMEILTLVPMEYPPATYKGFLPVMRPEANNLNRIRVDERRALTPWNILSGRLYTYWMRMFNSRWVDRNEAIEFLKSKNQYPPELEKKINKLAQPKYAFKTDMRGLSTQEKIELKKRMKREPATFDEAPIQQLLAEQMVRYSAAHFLANIDQYDLPPTAKEWFLLAPFRDDMHVSKPPTPRKIKEKPQDSDRYHYETLREMTRWMNYFSVRYLREAAPLAQQIRTEQPENRQAFPHMEKLVQEAMDPGSLHTQEQGWCYVLGGPSALYGAGQAFWNVLENPIKGWEKMPENDKANMKKSLLHVIKQDPPPAALDAQMRGLEPDYMQLGIENLHEVLTDYPQLREYSMDLNDATRILHLSPESLVKEEPHTFTHELPPTAEEYHLVLKDIPRGHFKAEVVSPIPHEFVDDSRVLPALRFLTGLRLATGGRPYADRHGIWWKNELYGGIRGKKPVGLQKWDVEAPLEPLFRLFDHMPSEGKESSTTVCGEPFSHVSDNLDYEDIARITTYRSKEYPFALYRLMPGEMNVANPRLHAPYVVHSVTGVPLTERYVKVDDSKHDIYQTLYNFKGTKNRIGYDDDISNGKAHLSELLYEMVHRMSSPQKMREGEFAEISNKELIMQLAVDTHFCEGLKDMKPRMLTAGEAAAAMIFRHFISYEYGGNKQAAAEELQKYYNRYMAERPLRDGIMQALDTARLRRSPSKLLKELKQKIQEEENPTDYRTDEEIQRDWMKSSNKKRPQKKHDING